MGLKRELFDFASNTVIRGLGLNRASRVVCNITEKISPIYTTTHNGETYHLSCPNDLTRYRAETLFTKEPETMEWIDTFKMGDVLFDIGANVGLYSIYAAKRGHKVVAFEPESQNYALINRNIFLNNLSDQIVCLNTAISDKDGVDFLFMPQFHPGGALNNLGEAVDLHHREFQAAFKQGVIAYSLDSFVAHFPQHFPNHIKLDVDGLESRIIRGAEKTLRDTRVKSLLVEINENLPGDLEICKFVETLGFKLLHKKQSALSASGEFKNIPNYVFVK